MFKKSKCTAVPPSKSVSGNIGQFMEKPYRLSRFSNTGKWRSAARAASPLEGE